MPVDVDKLAAEFEMMNSDVGEEPEIEVSFEVPEIKTHNAITIDPIEVITENINKANLLLNDIMREISTGNTSPRMYEVASALINATTQAADKVFTSRIAYDTMGLKQKLYDLKEKELAVKERFLELRGGKQIPVNQNILIADRETVLRMLKNPQNPQNSENLLKQGESDGRNEYGLQNSYSEAEDGEGTS